MKIYLPDQAGKRHTIFVKPDMPECPSDWLDEGDEPKTFAVHFVDGMADVEKKLGTYMIERGLAYRSRLIQVRNNIVRAFSGKQTA